MRESTYGPQDGRKWVTEAQAEKILGISRRTLLKLRDSRSIPFYQLRRAIRYNIEDVQAALYRAVRSTDNSGVAG